MKRITQPARQMTMFRQTQEEALIAEKSPELARALSDLLLEALGAERKGGDDEPEDHV